MINSLPKSRLVVLPAADTLIDEVSLLAFIAQTRGAVLVVFLNNLYRGSNYLRQSFPGLAADYSDLQFALIPSKIYKTLHRALVSDPSNLPKVFLVKDGVAIFDGAGLDARSVRFAVDRLFSAQAKRTAEQERPPRVMAATV